MDNMQTPERALFCIAAALVAAGSGCTEAIARRSTHGAIGAAAERVGAGAPPGSVVQRATRNVTASAFEELTTDERRAVLMQLSHDVAGAAAAGMHRELAAAIGPDGNGPLSAAVAQTAARTAQSMVFPECTGNNRAACIQAQVEALADSMASGFARAVRRQLGLGALLVAFVAGVLCTISVLSLVTTLQAKRIAKHSAASPQKV